MMKELEQKSKLASKETAFCWNDTIGMIDMMDRTETAIKTQR